MNSARKVLLIVGDGAASDAPSGLADALRELGAEVRLQALRPPYGELLDALADGWLPVHVAALPAQAAAAPDP